MPEGFSFSAPAAGTGSSFSFAPSGGAAAFGARAATGAKQAFTFAPSLDAKPAGGAASVPAFGGFGAPVASIGAAAKPPAFGGFGAAPAASAAPKSAFGGFEAPAAAASTGAAAAAKSAFGGFAAAAAPPSAAAAARKASAFGAVGGGGSAFGSSAAAKPPGSVFSLPKPAQSEPAAAPRGQQQQQQHAHDGPVARFPAIAWGPGDELQTVGCAAPEAADDEDEMDTESGPPQPPSGIAVLMGEPHMSAAYLQQLAQISYQVYSDLLLQHQQPVGNPEVLHALGGYEDSLMQCIQLATEIYTEASDEDAAEEARDDLLRLSMSAGILRLCRIFFFDEMGGSDLSGALREWFIAFSAGASESGGHVNILNPESCLDDGQLWQFLHKRTDFPQAWRLDTQWSAGPDSPGWRMVYAFATTGRLDHAWSLMMQIDQQSGISAPTKEVVNGWVELLEAGTSASDFVYKRQSLVEKAEGLVHSRSAPLEESALLQILSGNPEALGMHEPANWVEHLLGTVLYGKRSDGSFVSPVYNKEFVGETLAEGSMDIVEKLAESTGREVCTFMNPSLFKEICMQHARGVLQQIADPEVALGFVWLELHLGHALHVSGRLVDDMPIPAGPFQGASYLESLSLEYGEQCRAVPQLQRVALRIYLSCPLYGLEFIRETIGRMSAMTEKEARKLLSIAIAIGGQGAPEVAGTICRTMGAAASAEGRYSTATYWLVQAGDMPRADTLAEKMLVEMTEDLAEQRGCSGVLDMSGADAGGAPAAADARAARLQRSQELQNSAMVALQDSAAAGGRALPSALAFLCGLSELSTQVESLLALKAATVESHDGPLPELQEKIEVGVEHAVAQLMGLFGGGAGHLRQHWALLFDHAMTVSTILSPSLDRDETIALMGFLEQYSSGKSAIGQPSQSIGTGYGNARVDVDAEVKVLDGVRAMLAQNLAACLLTF